MKSITRIRHFRVGERRDRQKERKGTVTSTRNNTFIYIMFFSLKSRWIGRSRSSIYIIHSYRCFIFEEDALTPTNSQQQNEIKPVYIRMLEPCVFIKRSLLRNGTLAHITYILRLPALPSIDITQVQTAIKEKHIKIH